MTKEEIIEKLQEIGIVSTNCYPKTSFLKNWEIYVSLYRREMTEDFYFYNSYDKKLYRFPKPEDISLLNTENFKGDTKYLIPIHNCEVVWEDKEYVELPDAPFSTMTLRQYACIHLGKPNSGLDWLDILIKEKSIT